MLYSSYLLSSERDKSTFTLSAQRAQLSKSACSLPEFPMGKHFRKAIRKFLRQSDVLAANALSSLGGVLRFMNLLSHVLSCKHVSMR